MKKIAGGEGYMAAEKGAKLPVQYALGSDTVSGRFVEASHDTPW